MKLRNFFLPHPQTHKKAHLISVRAILFYIILFISLQVGLTVFDRVRPGVLGISSNVTVADIINLTNEERQKKGLNLLTEDSRLDAAAAFKASNMFSENYWAHYSPSGKDPWGFINGAGYKFTYAGENLARNFYNSRDVVNAWMASSTHRDNLLNPRYLNIGIAVMEGELNGQKTVLVVQEFGTPVEAIAQGPVKSQELVPPASQALVSPKPVVSTIPQPEVSVVPVGARTLVAGQMSRSQTLIDPFALSKNMGLFVIMLLFILIALDLYIIRRRAVIRLTSRHLPHLILLSISAGVLYGASPGSIL